MWIEITVFSGLSALVGLATLVSWSTALSWLLYQRIMDLSLEWMPANAVDLPDFNLPALLS